ncbi:MAG: ABC transporter [Pseudanabaena frigida]|uniref:ABC transporter n=1 Tax=Pseudanabaena frigida TaxID=945775 RepID=A0A2W4XVM8_9CYAN|nr:MAG: ABC transporter [Pseudanabaena frigida]
MSDTVIRVENLSKKYIIGHEKERYTALRDVIANSVKSIGRRFSKQEYQDPSSEEFWALKDVSFEIKQGDRVGIIGRNGAGKSTLLKILSRITEPTSGKISIRGRVASLLEVGTGFHPELTGRENIYLNGAILGMDRSEIKKKFDEIVAFAEIEKFLDTPVKRYSSGMYVRLAFAVAAHLEPEILIVDEVLAVGDSQFQKKCLGKMEDVSKEGRTILFVSHNMQAITSLTETLIFLSLGQLINKGKTEKMISEYLRYGNDQSFTYTDKPSDTNPKVTNVRVLTSEVSNTHMHGEPLKIEIEIATPFAINGGAIAINIVNGLQQTIAHTWLFDSEVPILREAGLHRLQCIFDKMRLYQGNYTLNVFFASHKTGEMFQLIENICPFEVVMFSKQRDYEWQSNLCTYLEDFKWEV